MHPALWDALRATPLSGSLPAELLLQLPAWGIYIAFPHPVGAIDAKGVYVWLDQQPDGACLQLLFDRDAGTALVPVRLASTVAEAIATSRADMEADRAILVDLPYNPGGPAPDPFLLDGLSDDDLNDLISSAVAACSAGADLVDSSGRRARLGRPLRPQPDPPTIWEAGWRVGPALGASAASSGGIAQGGSHSRPRPHLRGAHWHHYWLGPRNGPDRRLELRWISSTVVAGALDDLPTTVRSASPAPPDS